MARIELEQGFVVVAREANEELSVTTHCFSADQRVAHLCPLEY